MSYDDKGLQRKKWVNVRNKTWADLPQTQSTPPDVNAVNSNLPTHDNLSPAMGDRYLNLKVKLERKKKIGFE